ncbi:Hypothetical predicted protein [Podarcis lilfordi]|uniref:Uncharacterized protein n=1 Tax=Podarcis lilfordi TaxID=74358 RepID=A0AA35KR36_9SAUR|nr:Hypothetical predicted protein [Podarcis lilfordi]
MVEKTTSKSTKVSGKSTSSSELQMAAQPMVLLFFQFYLGCIFLHWMPCLYMCLPFLQDWCCFMEEFKPSCSRAVHSTHGENFAPHSWD